MPKTITTTTITVPFNRQLKSFLFGKFNLLLFHCGNFPFLCSHIFIAYLQAQCMLSEKLRLVENERKAIFIRIRKANYLAIR